MCCPAWAQSREPAGPVFLKEATGVQSVGVSCDSVHADQPAAAPAGSLWRTLASCSRWICSEEGVRHEEHQVRSPYRTVSGRAPLLRAELCSAFLTSRVSPACLLRRE